MNVVMCWIVFSRVRDVMSSLRVLMSCCVMVFPDGSRGRCFFLAGRNVSAGMACRKSLPSCVMVCACSSSRRSRWVSPLIVMVLSGLNVMVTPLFFASVCNLFRVWGWRSSLVVSCCISVASWLRRVCLSWLARW